ncbi:MAG: hypothetical protein MJ250_02525 [Alphaproteobacteria bacterium]|nr:hypothetical protein [Alphaproteobacteria bacterium]
MKITEQSIAEKIKTDNEDTELTDNELNDVVGGTTCVCSAQSFPNGTEAQIPSSADLAANQAMILAKQNLLQQAAQAMLAQENSNAANTLGLLQ